MSAAALLAQKPKPTDADIDAALSGNICRCGTYQRIRRAIHRAARSVDARIQSDVGSASWKCDRTSRPDA